MSGFFPLIYPFSAIVLSWNVGGNSMPKENSEPTTETIAETDNFLAWKANEPDGEVTYHLELNNVTLHFFREEWQEFLELVKRLE
jgi:hypothetical protein